MQVRAGRYTIEITHPDRILFPEIGFTKADLAAYYRRISPVLLSHIRDRALTLERYPGGITEDGFIQQRARAPVPQVLEPVRLEHKNGAMLDHLTCRNMACLQVIANRGAVTLHRWLSRVGTPDSPDLMIFDLDPPSADHFDQARQAALLLRDLLAELGLVGFPMTTGSKGLHVTVPLLRKADTDAVYRFSRDAARALCLRHPGDITTEQRLGRRRGRLYLDVSRNRYGQTAVAPYTIRARPTEPVATPLAWPEVSNKKLHSQRYRAATIFRRLAHKDDPWRGIGRRARALTTPRKKLDRILNDTLD